MDSERVANASVNVLSAVAMAGLASEPHVAALFGSSTPYVLAAAGAAMPHALESVGEAVRRLQERNANLLVAVAAQESELDVASILERYTGSPERLELFVRALRAAETTNLADKLLLLGRSLAAARYDEAVIDDELDFVRAVDLLEGRHMRVIDVLTSTWEQRGVEVPAWGREGPDRQRRTWTATQIAQVDAAVAAKIVPLAATLVAAGVVEDTTGGRFGGRGNDGPFLHLTDLGWLVVQRLRLPVGATSD